MIIVQDSGSKTVPSIWKFYKKYEILTEVRLKSSSVCKLMKRIANEILKYKLKIFRVCSKMWICGFEISRYFNNLYKTNPEQFQSIIRLSTLVINKLIKESSICKFYKNN